MGFLNFKSMYRTEKAFRRFLSGEVAIPPRLSLSFFSILFFVSFFDDSNDAMRYVLWTILALIGTL